MPNLWSIILAGGVGRRLATEAQRRYGYARPKQFCDFDGEGTLLERTMQRAQRLTPESRVVVVTTRSHRQEAIESLRMYPETQVVEQPLGRDTGPGILLALRAIEREDPAATVVMHPSDHYIHDVDGFVSHVRNGVRAAQTASERVVLLGAHPDEAQGSPESYGWMVPECATATRSAVRTFREKPPVEEAEALREAGARVNTFVMAGSLAAFVRLSEWWMPEWWQALATQERMAVENAYRTLPAVNFSREVLEPAGRYLDMYRLDPVGWSDIGTPVRLQAAFGEMTTHSTSRLAVHSHPPADKERRSATHNLQ